VQVGRDESAFIISFWECPAHPSWAFFFYPTHKNTLRNGELEALSKFILIIAPTKPAKSNEWHHESQAFERKKILKK
jgi:hypothetical protein